MSLRLTDYGGGYPWWAWLRPKPDLRSWCGGIGETGSRQVRLELALEPDRILLLDGQNWNSVLNRNYVTDTEEEWEKLANDADENGVGGLWPMPEPWNSRMLETWERIFDPDSFKVEIQAVFEKLELKDVVSVSAYKAKVRHSHY